MHVQRVRELVWRNGQIPEFPLKARYDYVNRTIEGLIEDQVAKDNKDKAEVFHELPPDAPADDDKLPDASMGTNNNSDNNNQATVTADEQRGERDDQKIDDGFEGFDDHGDDHDGGGGSTSSSSGLQRKPKVHKNNAVSREEGAGSSSSSTVKPGPGCDHAADKPQGIGAQVGSSDGAAGNSVPVGRPSGLASGASSSDGPSGLVSNEVPEEPRSDHPSVGFEAVGTDDTGHAVDIFGHRIRKDTWRPPYIPPELWTTMTHQQ